MTISQMYEIYNEERAKLVQRMEEGGAIMDLEDKRDRSEFEATVQIFKGEHPDEYSDRQIARRIARDEVFYVQASQLRSKMSGLAEIQDLLEVPMNKRVNPTAQDLLFGTPYGRYADIKLKELLATYNKQLAEDGIASGKARQKIISSTIFGSP